MSILVATGGHMYWEDYRAIIVIGSIIVFIGLLLTGNCGNCISCCGKLPNDYTLTE